VSDIGQAQTLLELTPQGAEAFLADKGYDCDAFVDAIKNKEMQAVIPCQYTQLMTRPKHYRRIFSRFEKLARNYMGFVRFVAALIWLR